MSRLDPDALDGLLAGAPIPDPTPLTFTAGVLPFGIAEAQDGPEAQARLVPPARPEQRGSRAPWLLPALVVVALLSVGLLSSWPAPPLAPTDTAPDTRPTPSPPAPAAPPEAPAPPAHHAPPVAPTTTGAWTVHMPLNAVTPNAQELRAMLSGAPRCRGTLEVVGHACTKGGADYNLNLSKLRADSIVKHLRAAGFPDDRLAVRAEGERDPRGAPKDQRRVDVRCIE